MKNSVKIYTINPYEDLQEIKLLYYSFYNLIKQFQQFAKKIKHPVQNMIFINLN